jgi:hypothetical protein
MSKQLMKARFLTAPAESAQDRIPNPRAIPMLPNGWIRHASLRFLLRWTAKFPSGWRILVQAFSRDEFGFDSSAAQTVAGASLTGTPSGRGSAHAHTCRNECPVPCRFRRTTASRTRQRPRRPVDPDDYRVASGGNFHRMPLAETAQRSQSGR